MGNKKEIRLSWAKLQGTAYQHLFIASALQKKLLVEQPVTDYPWDFSIRHPEKPKRALTVQVKGTNYLSTESTSRYKICLKTGAGNKHTYVDTDLIDVLAFYVEGTQTWYNMPSSAANGKSIWLYPHKLNSKGQYECWRHDWSVYKT